MKKYFSVLFIIAFFTYPSLKGQTDNANEEAKIKAVAEEETNAFIANNFNRFAATYVQDETCTRISASKSGYEFHTGWKEIGSMFKNYLDTASKRSDVKYVKTDYRIKIYGASAWETNNELVYNNNNEMVGKLLVTRFLEKVKNEWKMVYISVINTSSFDEKPIK
jgi:hypothetical protein